MKNPSMPSTSRASYFDDNSDSNSSKPFFKSLAKDKKDFKVILNDEMFCLMIHLGIFLNFYRTKRIRIQMSLATLMQCQ